jgi:hypothetical protein
VLGTRRHVGSLVYDVVYDVGTRLHEQ